MQYEIRFLTERRLSLKILAHRIKRYLPGFVYKGLILFRYTFFKRHCQNICIPNIKYSDGSWVERKTTSDLAHIQDFLQGVESPLKLLQIGIGNSSLFESMKQRKFHLTGITIVEEEVSYAQKKFPDSFGIQYEVRLMNKYSEEISTLGGEYDYIIDNDLSSYACCRYHFNVMLSGYKKLLTPKGRILIGINGLGYFDSGFGLNQGMIQKIAHSHGLIFLPGVEFHTLQLEDTYGKSIK
jgi:hypothetical protein